MTKKMTLYFFIFLFLFFSSINILRSSVTFFLENISIRESFYLTNIYLDVNKDGIDDFVHKGIKEGGSRYNDIFYKNFGLLKNLNFLEIKKLYSKIKKIDPSNTDFKLESDFVSKLIFLSNKSNSFKKESAIYIPKTMDFFWNMSCDTHAVPFIVTGITNIAMIFGLPEDNKTSCYGKKRDYGYNQLYLLQKKPFYYNFKKIPTDILCKEALNKNFKKIIEINLNSKNEIIFINHICKK